MKLNDKPFKSVSKQQIIIYMVARVVLFNKQPFMKMLEIWHGDAK